MAEKRETLVMRADSGPGLGTEHVSRCLALAQAWQDQGGQAVLITAAPNPIVQTRLAVAGIEPMLIEATPGSAEDARQTARIARQRRAAWVVLDGDGFGASYQRAIKRARFPLVLFVDHARAEHYWADLVVNPSLDADPRWYPEREPGTRLLLGPRWVPLRREFSLWRNLRQKKDRLARRILVTLGSDDPDNVTLKVIEALQQTDMTELEVVVIAAARDPHYPQWQAALEHSRVPIRLRPNLSEMPGLMAWADLAVGGVGLGFWERAFVGLPGLLVVRDEREQAAAELFAHAGAAVNLGRGREVTTARLRQRLISLIQSPQRREGIRRKARGLVDGEGADRICTLLRGEPLRLRRTRAGDCATLWRLANESEVRQNSFTTGPIDWETHVEWLREKLLDPRAYLFVGVNGDDVPIGRIRFVGQGPNAQVSITVAKKHRGLGYATMLLRLGIRRIFAQTSITEIHALIKPFNQASLRLFEHAGFHRLETVEVGDQEAEHYVLQRTE